VVPRGAFWPVPDVDGGVIVLRPLPAAEIERDVSFEELRTVVKAAFHMRRKTLRNGLQALAKERGLAVDDVFATADIDPKERAEQVPVKGFVRLARALRAPV
jgi:16S rRNA (adenine1518-N6/adenine1519-N6)-dimethyltransferase